MPGHLALDLPRRLRHAAAVPPAAIIEARDAHRAAADRQKAGIARWARAIAAALLIALGLRTCVYEPFNIPSESMLPGLFVGDYLFVAKWPYGYSRFSLPLGLPLFEGRIGGAVPERGDIIVFKTPRDNRTDFIKRVIGLPGDRVRMTGGRVEVNGQVIPQTRIADAIVPPAPGGDCASGPGRPDFRVAVAGRMLCRFPAYHESHPGRVVTVLDQTQGDTHDDTATVTVPAGHVFVLGDNRDDSADSRFSIAEGGVGMVPLGNIIGRADRIFFSIDPMARGFAKIRADRIGRKL